MSERYTRLFALPENLHTPTSPVVIAAGALLKDNKTGRSLAQIKLRSCSAKAITGATLAVSFRDAAGRSVGDEVLHSITGMQVVREEEFGQKNPVVLSEGEAVSYTVRVAEISFADGTVWTGGMTPWAALAAPVLLQDALGSAELAEEYALQNGGNCTYLPAAGDGVWTCTCGALNGDDEEVCYRCGKATAALFACDVSGLAGAREARLAAAAAKKKKIVKTGIIAAVAAVVLIVGGLLISNAVQKSNAYKNANALLAEGKYSQAEKAFAELGDYKDSEELLADVPYQKAQKLMADGDLDDAREAFLALGDYKDSAAIAEDIPYQQAVNLLNEDKLDRAEKAFAALGDYKDSKDYLADIPYLRAHDLLEAGDLDGALVAFEALGNYKDSKDIVADIPYQKAMGFMAQESWQEALDILVTLGNYKDSEQQAVLATQALCDHAYTDSVTKEPNCTETGIRQFVCGKCEKSYEETIPIAHKYKETVTRAATCSKEGEKKMVCSECNDTQISAIAMIDHKFSAATCTKAKTCTACGATSGSPLPHNYAAATCQKPKTCVDCGATTGSVSAHNYAAATCELPRTCTVCAATTGSPNGHRWTNATCASPKKCSTCGKTEGIALPHNFFSGSNYVGICSACRAMDSDWRDYVDVSFSREIVNGFQIVGYDLSGARRSGSWIEFDLTVYVQKVEESDARTIRVRSSGDSYLPSSKTVSSYDVGDGFSVEDDSYFYGYRSFNLYLSGY